MPDAHHTMPINQHVSHTLLDDSCEASARDLAPKRAWKIRRNMARLTGDGLTVNASPEGTTSGTSKSDTNKVKSTENSKTSDKGGT